MKPYIVRPGDYLQEIAFRLGFNADEVWNHSKNSKVKQARGNMNLLTAGDILYIPDDPPTTFKISPGGTYEFNVDVPRVEVTLVLSDPEISFASCQYEVRGSGVSLSGKTDDKGKLTFSVPAYVREVLLSVPERLAQFRVEIGGIDHPSDRSGLKTRLMNLGYLPDLPDFLISDDDLASALAKFQADHDLTVTGKPDEDTIAALQEAHGD